MPKVSVNETPSGFTHYRVLTHDDFIAAAASSTATTATIAAIGIPTFGIVERVVVSLQSTFIHQDTVSAMSFTSGDGTDPDGFVESTGTIGVNTGDYFDSSNYKTYNVADTIDVVITSDAGAISGLTVGSIIVAARILDIASLSQS